MLEQNIGAMWDAYLAQQVEDYYAEEDEYTYEDYLEDKADADYDEMRLEELSERD